ncbi:hypothetical protein ACIRP3_36125 [Streptomyces sp. NPDC101209]|uniref:effector-associated constant component EACC1 n=1 Tax=Streptomyces sp. NPDC101209 TaxID=3366129 RepID=UPI0037FC5071
MAEGDGVADQEIRVRLDRTAGDRDVVALRQWLEREEPLAEGLRRGELQIELRDRRNEDPGTPMGFGTEVVVVVIGGAASAAFKELMVAVRLAVVAWRENRRSVEAGDPPEAQVGGAADDR